MKYIHKKLGDESYLITGEWESGTKFKCGITINNNVVIRSAPIIKNLINQMSKKRLQEYCIERGWSLHKYGDHE